MPAVPVRMSKPSRQKGVRDEPSSTAAIQIVREAVRDGISVADLARLAAADPVFALRVLSVANSAAYGRGQPVAEIQQAASLLGIRGLRNVALGLLVTDLVPPGPVGEVLLGQSIRRALACRAIAGLLGDRDADGYFTAGLLLESGLLIQAEQGLEHVEAIIRLPSEFRVTMEQAAGSIAHPERGAELASGYHLPEETIEAIRRHHDLLLPDSRLARGCWLAEKVAAVFECAVVDEAKKNAEVAFASAGLSAMSLAALLEELPAMVAQVAEGFQRPVGEQLNLEQLRADAHARLVMMNTQLEATVRRLQEVLEEKENLTLRLKAANLELANQATTDSLTGLLNRRGLEEALTRDLARALREKKPLSFIVLDVDHFKKFNDTHGHQLGDEVLRAVGRVLMQTARVSDVPARFGGEEFCIVLPNAETEGAGIAAERFRKAIESVRVSSDQGPLQVTASFGVATFDPKEPVTKKVLFEQADQALYAAKQAGRNCVKFAPVHVEG